MKKKKKEGRDGQRWRFVMDYWRQIIMASDDMSTRQITQVGHLSTRELHHEQFDS